MTGNNVLDESSKVIDLRSSDQHQRMLASRAAHPSSPTSWDGPRTEDGSITYRFEFDDGLPPMDMVIKGATTSYITGNPL